MKPLAGPLAHLLDRVIPPETQFDAVVPVPLHWRKQWDRGFNQADLLARHVARRRHIPVLHALRRKRSTATQAGLAVAGRRRNVAGAFEARRSQKGITGARILLIDDVMTTGATANACAVVLKRSGAKSVSLLTLARVDRRWRD
jgi:ComF family protein